jgi:hypothetical protein
VLLVHLEAKHDSERFGSAASEVNSQVKQKQPIKRTKQTIISFLSLHTSNPLHLVSCIQYIDLTRSLHYFLPFLLLPFLLLPFLLPPLSLPPLSLLLLSLLLLFFLPLTLPPLSLYPRLLYPCLLYPILISSSLIFHSSTSRIPLLPSLSSQQIKVTISVSAMPVNILTSLCYTCLVTRAFNPFRDITIGSEGSTVSAVSRDTNTRARTRARANF